MALKIAVTVHWYKLRETLWHRAERAELTANDLVRAAVGTYKNMKGPTRYIYTREHITNWVHMPTGLIALLGLKKNS
jgi:hypothetical protein